MTWDCKSNIKKHFSKVFRIKKSIKC